MSRRAALFALAASVATALVTACTSSPFGDDEPPVSCRPTQQPAVDPDGERWQYLIDSIQLGDGIADSVMYGADLDCDPAGHRDNALGQILGLLSERGYDIDGEANQLIAAGAMLNLVEVRARSFIDARGVDFTFQHGVDTDGDPTDNFSGQERFQLDRTRGYGQAAGAIELGRLIAEPGTLPIAVAFPGRAEPYYMTLVGVRVVADVAADRLVGRIAGALPAADIDGALMPALHDGLSRIVAAECPDGACAEGSFGSILLDIFDQDGDGALSLSEVRDNALVASLFRPDIDLFDADGNFWPRADGVLDGLSFGLGFTAVPASFPAF